VRGPLAAVAIALLSSGACYFALQDSIPEGWQILGPGGGGSQYRPTVSPHDPNTVLIACDMTGAYITYDGGRQWREFNLRTRVDAFAFDPVNPDVIYAGSSGLFRSEDRGRSWRLVFPDPSSVITERMVGDHAEHSFVSGDNWPGGAVQAIRVDPEQTERIFLGIRSGGLLVYLSTDAGKTWKPGARLAGSSFRKLYVDAASPRENRRLLIFTDRVVQRLAVESLQVEPASLPPGVDTITDADCGMDPGADSPVCDLTTPARWEGALLHSGGWKTADLGETWQELSAGLDQNLAGTPRFTVLSASEKDARTVYLAVQSHPEVTPGSNSSVNYYGIFKTENGGESWDWVLRALGSRNPANKQIGWIERNYGPGWGESPLGLGAGGSEGNVCYAADMGTSYRTTDGGQTWEQVYSRDEQDGSSSSSGLDVTTSYGVHFDPFDKDHLVISYTDIGLSHSRNGGRTWLHAIRGAPRSWINTCYWVVFDPEVKGRAWSVWGNAHDLPRPKMFTGNFDRYLGGVCRSEDGLENWQQSSEGMPPNCLSTHILLDARTPTGNRTLYVAGFGKGVFKSTDDGRTWTLKNNGIQGNLNAWRLVERPDGILYLLVARGLVNNREVDGALYRSRDEAESWEKVALPEGVNAPNDLVLDPAEPQRMYLACWPKTINGVERYGGVWTTEDGGASWRNLFEESAHAYALAVDPDQRQILYLNTFDSAAYRSEDLGQSWQRLEGYDFKWGHRPVLDPHHKGMLYLTTFGSSVWYGPVRGVPEQGLRP